MPNYTVQFWQLCEAEITEADTLQQAETAARDFLKDRVEDKTHLRFHSIREVGRESGAKCADCAEDKREQTGPWKKGAIYTPKINKEIFS